MRIAHVINPVKVGPASDLHFAQPITFETMRRAREFAAGVVSVALYTVQFPEDEDVAPAHFRSLSNLDRSVLDLEPFQERRKLPLIRDILDRLYRESDADFFVYTNVDIALKPHFYVTLERLLQERDALVINRRTIRDDYRELEQIPLMWAELGRKHGGFDCFVFRRSEYPRYQLADTCIGIKGIGVALYANLAAFSERMECLQEADLTFHIGNDMRWTSAKLDDYTQFNYRQVNASARALRPAAGALNATTRHGRFLLDRYHKARHHYLHDSLALDNDRATLAIVPPRRSGAMGAVLRALRNRILSPRRHMN